MKILLISGDKDLFREDSESFQDLVRIGKETEQMHVIVFTLKKEGYSIKNISNNIFVYPTNSGSSLGYIFDAISIAQLQVLLHKKLIVDLVVAANPFLTSVVAYVLALRYKKHFLVDASKNLRSALREQNALSSWIQERIALYVFPRATGILVPSQAVGEILCTEISNIENKIYILARAPLKTTETQTSKEVDIRSKYTEFNLLLLTVIEPGGREDVKKLIKIMRNLRIHYPRVGLVAIDNDEVHKGTLKLSVKNNVSYVVWEKEIHSISSYFKQVHMYIDVSEKVVPAPTLIEAALSGCPIVASQSSGNKLVVRHAQNGFLADPDNVAEFSGRIVEILETPGLREMMRVARYEVEQLNTKPIEEYEKSLVEIWKVVSENKNDLGPDAIQEYTSGLVHTLIYTRAYVSDAFDKIKHDMSGLRSKIVHPKQPKKKREFIDLKNEDSIDVDKVLKI